jgi:hypothetical protein
MPVTRQQIPVGRCGHDYSPICYGFTTCRDALSYDCSAASVQT